MSVASRCLLLALCLLLSGCIDAQQQTATYYAYSDASCTVPLFNQTVSLSGSPVLNDTTLSTSSCTAVSGPSGLTQVVIYCAHSSDQFTWGVSGYTGSSCSGSSPIVTSSNNGWCNGGFSSGGSILVQCNAAMARQHFAASAALAVAFSVLVLMLL